MNGREWTPDDSARLKRLVARGLTSSQIGETMDRHERLIREKLKALDLKPGQSPIFTAMMARINYRRMVRA